MPDVAIISTLVVFVAVFFAELPDKTALASLVLGTRYSAWLVFVGMAGAFAVHVAIAIAAGRVLRLLPHRPLSIVISVLFVAGAVLLLREGRDKHGDEQVAEPVAGLSNARVVLTSFSVIFVAEFGDLTQILTANLAAEYHDTAAVAVGAVLALWAVGGLAIVGGKALLRRISLTLITRIAAAIMLALGAYSIVAAISG